MVTQNFNDNQWDNYPSEHVTRECKQLYVFVYDQQLWIKPIPYSYNSILHDMIWNNPNEKANKRFKLLFKPLNIKIWQTATNDNLLNFRRLQVLWTGTYRIRQGHTCLWTLNAPLTCDSSVTTQQKDIKTMIQLYLTLNTWLTLWKWK